MNILSRPPGDGVPIEGGRFAELSTLHLSATTARLLDLWAGPLAQEASMLVAVNVKGWFVATRPAVHALSCRCPADLRGALRFGRARGFDYLFFHCDAPVIVDLPRFTW